MAAVTDLVLVALVGIIDPLREEAKESVRIALRRRGRRADDHGRPHRHGAGDRRPARSGAGRDHGDAISPHLPDDEVVDRLPELHVFGRVAPEDKVRLARLMQEAGQVVAMTGDAVNDAAALKQADIGVAMGSGSEVTKQAAKIVLTDDNFATLVRAVELGRDIYRRITSYVKLQLTILSSVLQLMLLATILNINDGVALFPMQLLFCKFFVVVTVVIGFIVDVPDPSVMQRPPRKPGTRIVTEAADRAVGRQRLRCRGERPRGARVGARMNRAPRTPSIVDDDGFRDRGDECREPRPGDAARTRTGVVVADLPVPGVDHPGLDAHVGGRAARHAPAVARHRLAHGEAVGAVLLLSLIAPGIVWVDKTIQLARCARRSRRRSNPRDVTGFAAPTTGSERGGDVSQRQVRLHVAAAPSPLRQRDVAAARAARTGPGSGGG